MQSEHQHIDEFFRKKEEQWDAGSDDLQQDWQQMLPLMPSVAIGVDSKPSFYRLLKFGAKLLGGVVTLAVVVGVVIWFSNREKLVAKKNEAAVAVVAEPTLKQDTVSTVQANPPSASASVTAPAPVAKKLNAYPTNQPRTRDQAIIPDTTSVVTEPVKPDAATMMKTFYDAIKKESKEFNIAADRDTTIEGGEGTLLAINAYSFADENGPIKSGNVRVKLTEFYKNDDIVAAKLSTTSNGRQLVTGGMIHLTAEKNGKPVNVMPGRSIQVQMPTKNYDGRMQLFAQATRARTGSDTMAAGSDLDGSFVNWLPAGQSQMRSRWSSEKGIDTIDLSVAPYRVNYRTKTVAKFFYDNDLKITKDELREKLYKQYGTYYDKIILRKARKRETRERINNRTISFNEALAAGLMSKQDSLNYVRERRRDSANYVKTRRRDSVEYFNKLKVLKYYNFSLPATGWFNCDYFERNNANPINFTVNFGEGNVAETWVAQLVFTRIRSTITGFDLENKVQFRGIPDNEQVFVVCVGVKEGKMVSAIVPFNTSSRQVRMPLLEETSPEAFRQKLQVLNKPIPPQ